MNPTKKNHVNNNNNNNNNGADGNWNPNFSYRNGPIQNSQQMPYSDNQKSNTKNSHPNFINNNHNSNNNNVFIPDTNFNYDENVYPYMEFAMQPPFDPVMLPPTQQTIPPSQHQRQPLQMNSPAINGMLTPFDTAYGATLLPSHLLMGSPFMASPNMHTPQQFSQATFGRHRNSNGYNTNNNTLAKNNNNTRHNSVTNLSNNNNMNPSQRNFPSKQQQHDVPSTTEPIEYTEEMVTKMESLFNNPFQISYKILPKGDDAYRTRSLLLENIDKSINIHDFITKFVKSTEIESVYVILNDDKQNILLSFMTVQICLNFYNNVLQRLKEFKIGLNSEDMNLNFILLHYIKESGNTDNTTKDNDISMFRFDPLMDDATRSIAIELKEEYDESKITSLLNNLKLSKTDSNKRYVLESVAIFNTGKGNKTFAKNYAILTFLNISMAIEILNYLRYKSEEVNINKCFFVNVSCATKKQSISDSENQDTVGISNVSTLPANNSMSNLPNPSSVSLLSSQSSLNLNHNADDFTELLQKIKLDDNHLAVDPKSYPEPSIEILTDHQPNISKSYSQLSNLGGRSNSILSTPRPLDRYFPETSSFPPMDGIGTQNNTLVPQTPMGITTPSFYMEQPPFKYTKNLPQPITDTLEDQLNTSAKVASAMGSDVANRTIYIGNINPRSKPEDVCNVVRGGILQSIKFIESKHICFITFIEPSAAVQFYANTFIDPIILHGNTLKIGWGNYSGPLAKSVALAVTVGASRNVYVSLPEVAFKDKFINDPEYEMYHEKYSLPSEEQLRKDFSSYGSIEQINYLSDSHCCWVNFMNINSAIKLVEDATNRTEQFSKAFNHRYDGLIINYGKDRCGNMNRNLVSKNARFNKKIKRNTRNNNKLSYLEEKRRNQDFHKKSFPQSSHKTGHNFNKRDNDKDTNQAKFIPLDSLGISIDHIEDNNNNFSAQLSPIIDRNEDKNDLNEKSPSNESNEMEAGKNDVITSESSSDSEIPRNANSQSPKNSSHFPRQYNSDLSVGLGLGIDDTQSTSPDTTELQDKKENGNAPGNHSKIRNPTKKVENFNGMPKNGRTIPGSDVMAQYLAQLQHSNFIYAANVLGASKEQTELYTQDE